MVNWLNLLDRVLKQWLLLFSAVPRTKRVNLITKKTILRAHLRSGAAMDPIGFPMMMVGIVVMAILHTSKTTRLMMMMKIN